MNSGVSQYILSLYSTAYHNSLYNNHLQIDVALYIRHSEGSDLIIENDK